MGVRPKKHLGQHFLTNQIIAENIVEAAQINSNTPILEIGPGMGVLTQYIEPLSKNFFLIEIDSESVDYLYKNFPSLSENIFEQDFLNFDIQKHFPEGMDLIGNFPYNISAPILFQVLKYKSSVNKVTGMFQKEVAQRIAAPHGNKTYGILSVYIQSFFKTELLFTVSPGNFNPPPKVDSAVLQLTKIPNRKLDCDETLFFKVVKVSFHKRRKMLRNSLKDILGKTTIDNEIMTKRPEQLSPKDFEFLTNLVAEHL
ncbi:MAG: 16S rRNA (adenine(1518)-N(6)/adenine(1519)-N(6))-dimethyltransferase RsmA [Bacteroidota bacterium]|nr:16S rRNA (adenine(1518)-N(6)/adenine(1519)-N(6))-dimethyltransferase RsmA [Bacteroidota bacterium]